MIVPLLPCFQHDNGMISQLLLEVQPVCYVEVVHCVHEVFIISVKIADAHQPPDLLVEWKINRE